MQFSNASTLNSSELCFNLCNSHVLGPLLAELSNSYKCLPHLRELRGNFSISKCLPFTLDIKQEYTIQHWLVYRHNCNCLLSKVYENVLRRRTHVSCRFEHISNKTECFLYSVKQRLSCVNKPKYFMFIQLLYLILIFAFNWLKWVNCNLLFRFHFCECKCLFF